MSDSVLSGFARPRDAGIYYEVSGNGPAVLLLHGNGESLRVFDTMADALRDGFRVVAVDTRGHGRSERGDAPFRFETFARDVSDIMSALDIQGAHIVGYSDGGATAMHLALSAPDSVASITLLGANLSPKGVHPRFQVPTQLGYYARSAIAALDRKALRKKEMLELMVRHPNLTEQQISAISCPALVMAGRRDIIRRSHTASIARAIHGARLVILPGDDHFSLPTSPDVIREIRSFLTELADGNASACSV